MKLALPSAATIGKIALGVAALAATTGLAFAGWIDHAPAILMTLAETGMAWCF